MMDRKTEGGEAEGGKGTPTVGDLLCFAVYSAEHAFTQLYRPLLAEMGLTYPQYLVMVLLWEEDDRSVGDLGQALRLQSNTLTPLLKRLEATGLVSRRRDAEDERVVRIALTDRGRALQEKAAHVKACVGAATGLSLEEIKAAVALISRLRDNVSTAAEAGTA